MRDFEGKVAFITGGSSGIGLAMALTFIRKGMQVAIADLHQDRLRDAEAMLLQESPFVLALRVDVAHRGQMAWASRAVKEHFGKLHVLCNNADAYSAAPADTEDHAEWDWILGVNLLGVINGLVHFLPLIKSHAEGGHVVNTSSISGIAPFSPTGGVYGAAKCAVTGLTACLRLNLAPQGIGVSALCAGTIATNLPLLEMSRPSVRPNGRAGVISPKLPPGLAKGMDPMEAAARVLRGIEQNAAYIFTHGEFREAVRDHFDAILGAFPVEEFPPERLAAEAQRRKVLAEAGAGIATSKPYAKGLKV